MKWWFSGYILSLRKKCQEDKLTDLFADAWKFLSVNWNFSVWAPPHQSGCRIFWYFWMKLICFYSLFFICFHNHIWNCTWADLGPKVCEVLWNGWQGLLLESECSPLGTVRWSVELTGNTTAGLCLSLFNRAFKPHKPFLY